MLDAFEMTERRNLATSVLLGRRLELRRLSMANGVPQQVYLGMIELGSWYNDVKGSSLYTGSVYSISEFSYYLD